MIAHTNHIKINNIRVKTVAYEKKFPRKKFIILSGTCTVETDDFGITSFEMNFTYKGVPDEPKHVLITYLKARGWEKYMEMFGTKEETLLEFVNRRQTKTKTDKQYECLSCK